MSEIVSNQKMIEIKKDIINEISKAEEQNNIFKKNGVYPEWNMDDVLKILNTQLKTINNIVTLGERDFNEVYNTESSDTFLLAEDLNTQENQLKEDIGVNELIDSLSNDYNETNEDIDMLIDTVFNNTFEKRVNEFIKDSDVSISDMEIDN